MPEVSIHVDAPLATVWSELVDVERWPEWTASISRIERLDDGAFAVGARARIKQPGVPALVWEVTALEPERAFTWTCVSPGMTTVAGHELSPADGGVDLRLTLEQRGALSPVMRLLMGRRTMRYITMEAEGLKRRSENR